jgi:hypothetical protein
MKGIPLELIFALIFVGVVLFQFLKRRSAEWAERARRAAQEPEPQPGEQAPAFDNFLDFGRLEQPAAATWARPPVTIETPRTAPAIAASTALASRRRRRFSRESLLGSRRDVQDAMVIAAILGPCRGMDPPGGAPLPDATGRPVR